MNADALHLVIPATVEGYPVTAIGEYAFFGRTSFISVTIPASVKRIEGSAFDSCTSLLSVTFAPGSQCTMLGGSSFARCTALSSLEIPASVTSLSASSFTDCTSLYEVEGGIAYIGTWAIRCINTNARYLVIREGTEKIACDALWLLNLLEIWIPSSVSYIVEGAIGGRNLTLISVAADNPYYTSIDGDLYSKDGKTLLRHCEGKGTTVYQVPSTVTRIGGSAFWNCSSLTAIAIPSSVTSIGEYAFLNCSALVSVELPASVTELGQFVFSGCKSLEKITVAAGNPSYKSVDGVLYTKDGTTLLQYPPAKNETHYTVPDGVTAVAESAFQYSSLVTVALPDGLLTIGERAFAGCQSLVAIKIPASVTTIGRMAFNGCTSLTEFTVPEGVVVIEYGLLTNCQSLTEVHLPASVALIRASVFSRCALLETVYYGGTEDEWREIYFVVAEESDCGGADILYTVNSGN